MTGAKKIIGIVGVVVLVIGLVVAVLLVRQQQELRKKAAPATTLTMAPSTQSPAVGDTFTVNVQIDSGVNSLTAADLDITFDSQKLTMDEIKENAFLPNASNVAANRPTIDNTLGTAKISVLSNAGTPAQGQGILATMKFRAKAAGTANIGFGPGTKVAGRTDNVREDIDLVQTKTPARITILAGTTSSPSPSPSPSPTTSPSPGSSPHPSPSPTASPRPTASPSSTPGTGGNTSTSPTPTASSSTSSNSKPTISLPSNKVVTTGATLTGTAKAGSTVTITVKSDPITATVTADSAGKWSYTLPSNLAAGSHTITVTDANGTTSTTFTISGTTGVVTPSAGNIPVTGFDYPTFLGLGAGALLLVFGLLLAI